MILKTWNEWQAIGKVPYKGSKAVWIEGFPMFTERQVVAKAPSTAKRRAQERAAYNYPCIDEEFDWVLSDHYGLDGWGR